MTSQGIAHRRPVYHCYRCGHDWRTVRVARPVRCGKCKSANWDKPRDSGVVTQLQTEQQTVERLMRAAKDILRTNAKCTIGKDLTGTFRAITPLMLPRWKATPNLYGKIVCHIDKETTAEELGEALFGVLWTRRLA